MTYDVLTLHMRMREGSFLDLEFAAPSFLYLESYVVTVQQICLWPYHTLHSPALALCDHINATVSTLRRVLTRLTYG